MQILPGIELVLAIAVVNIAKLKKVSQSVQGWLKASGSGLVLIAGPAGQELIGFIASVSAEVSLQ